jgi:hypothetical protein
MQCAASIVPCVESMSIERLAVRHKGFEGFEAFSGQNQNQNRKENE